MKQRFIIVDGNALLHRAWHALPPLTTKKGELVNAVYGFILVFLKVLKELKPNYIAVTFDKKEPTFRHKEFKEYKAGREKQPDELYQQIPRIKELIEAFNVSIYEKDGFEADDIIGTLTKEIAKKFLNIENIIVTGDLDTLQLVDERTKVYGLKKGITETILYDQRKVREKYNLEPRQLIDFKALKGDPSDNIPGVKGIGDKTATELLKNFKTLKGVYQNLDLIKEKTRKLLEENKDKAFFSKKLVTIVEDVPINFDLNDCKIQKFNRNKIIRLFQELEFKSLLERIPQGDSTKDEYLTIKKEVNYQLIETQEKFEKFLKIFKKQKIFALDTETTNLDPFRAELLGISFSWKEKEAFYLCLDQSKSQLKNIHLNELKKFLEDPEIIKVGHNIKYDLGVLNEAGIFPRGISFDTMIASYLLNPGSRVHGLDNLVFAEFGHRKISFSDLAGQEKTLSIKQIPLEKLSYYSCEDADYAFRLVPKLRLQLEEKNLLNLFQKIEMPLVSVLVKTERNGVKINSNFLKNLSQELENKIQKLKVNIYKLVGCQFNIDSPLQLKEVLFEKLKITSQEIKKIKTGLSTAAKELEKLKGQHPAIDLILEYRELSKSKSTYLDALPILVNSKTDRIHTNFNQTITATGRLSSSGPNLQNIPIRSELGCQIRKAFIAEPGYKLVSIDYSQIELRIAASLANDQKMIETFKRGKDIHQQTASEIFGCPLDKVSSLMRRQAKTINFGIIYGMGVHGLAQAAGLGQEEAKNFMEKYFTVHQGIKNYIEETKALARSLGYVETLFGRRRWLPDIVSNVAQIKNAAERMAINFPIQGTAADIIKMAMIELDKQIDSLGWEIKMILQVHDELVFEIKEDLVKKASPIIKEIMETVCHLRVPLEAEVFWGNNWGEMEKIN